ncbi:uncharacterized protein [Henckelia pumila]|uniref:uncharacterized protein n=1 Tax=Henckelia pumila TaxID=405737 RepID=UPI003C6E4A5B
MNKGNQMIEIAAVATEMNSVELEETVEQVHYANNKKFSGYQGNPPPNHYHPGLHNHENFSYANNNNVLNPPPGFNNKKGEGKPSLKDLVSTFVTESSKNLDRSESHLDNLETYVTNMGTTMKFLEVQIGQLASAINNQHRGMFSSNTETNPKEHCNATILRYVNEFGQATKYLRVEEKDVAVETPSDQSKRGLKTKSSTLSKIPDILKTHMPFPQRFQKRGLDAQFAKFLEVFKKIHINIPFAETLERMPSYAKFMKEILSKKKKFAKFENVALTEECSAIIQKKLPQKLKDPDSFKIPCDIGGQFVGSSLCDLGESVNLMPISVYKKLGLTEMKPTRVMLQLADKSAKSPCGLVEDVLVKKIIMHVPIILGRPFLAIGEAKIDVKKGELTMQIEDEQATFNVFEEGIHSKKDLEGQKLRQDGRAEKCYKLEVIEEQNKEPDIVKRIVKKFKKKRDRIMKFWKVKEKNKSSNKVAVTG